MPFKTYPCWLEKTSLLFSQSTELLSSLVLLACASDPLMLKGYHVAELRQLLSSARPLWPDPCMQQVSTRNLCPPDEAALPPPPLPMHELH